MSAMSAYPLFKSTIAADSELMVTWSVSDDC